MAKRKPKIFPPNTFLPLPQRLMAIVQLCIAFSLLLWYATQPFMGEYFALRSRMLLYEYVMGTSTASNLSPVAEAKLKRQAKSFDKLPDKDLLHSEYQQIEEYAKRPIFQKIEEGLHRLMFQVPPFELAWIFFSIVISIMLLMKREGAKQAAWLLPIIVMAYSADNYLTGKPPVVPPDHRLFPSEEVIVQNYLSEPFGSTPQMQKEQLERGWQRYLIEHWSSGSGESLEEGEYRFTLARLNLLRQQPKSDWLFGYHEQQSGAILTLYFLWNLMFAWVMYKRINKRDCRNLA